MAEGDRAAVDVGDLRADTELAHGLDPHRGKRFVDLVKIHVSGSQALLAQRRRDRVGRLGLQRGVRAGDEAVLADLGEYGQPELDSLRPAHHHDRRRAVGDLRGRAGRDRAVVAEGGTQLRQRLRGGVTADTLVLADEHRVTAALGHLDRDDLVVEQPVLDRGGGALMGAGGELVLLDPADAQPRVVPLGSQPHRDLVDRAEQGIVGGGVQQLGTAVADALTQGRQQVRGTCHRLHATGDDDVELATGDVGVGECDRVQTRQADLVHRDRGNVHGDAAPDRGLASGDLPLTRLNDMPHDHIVDLLTTDTGPRQRGLDRKSAELDGGEALQSAGQLADRGSRAGHDDRTRHGWPPGSATACSATIT